MISPRRSTHRRRVRSARPGRSRWCLAALLGAVLGVLGVWSTAAAHAELESTSPEAGSILPESPTRVVLTFSEPVDVVDGSIRVVSGDGDEVDIGAAGQALGDDTIAADVADLPDGTYVVAWRAVSADSHPISGAFTFSVGAETATDAGLVDHLVEDETTARPVERWLGVGRWASFGGIAVLLGALATSWRAGSPTWRRPRTRRLAAAACAVALAGTLVMIVAQGSIIRGPAFEPGSWRVVAGTRAGRWWVVRAAVLAFSLPVVLVGLHRRGGGAAGIGAADTDVDASAPDDPRAADDEPGTAALAVVMLGGTGLLAVVAAGGHGVTGRAVPFGFLATWFHLGAMCAWVGGLVALTVLVPRGDVRHAAGRFSPVAFGSLVVLALTGAVNGWRQAESFEALRDSPYGRWLLVKLVVIAAVVAVAGVSRWVVRDATPGASAEIGVRRAVRLEVAGMIVVLAATAGLTGAAPPRDATPGVLTVSDVEDDRLAQVVLDPPVTGGTTMHVYVSSTTGAIAPPISIEVTGSLPDRGVDRLALDLEQEGPGHLTSDDVDLPLPGRWTFTVAVRYEFDEVRFVVTADIREGAGG